MECDVALHVTCKTTTFYTHLWPPLLNMTGLAVSLREGPRLIAGVDAIGLLTFDLGLHLVKKAISAHILLLLVHVEAACHSGAW